ncbi:MAG TPA: PEP-CTERM sorting domain-containing protein, partial [Pirellulales bacterium]
YDFGSQTYSLYSLGAFGTYGFSDIGSGTFYGSLEISTEGIETISLNAAALADITAGQGGTFSLGGIDSGETAYPATTEGNFAFTTSDNSVSLALVTTPEPSTLALLVLGAFGLCLAARRCR